MKKQFLLIVSVAFICIRGYAQGFAPSPINWTTPMGGQYSSSSVNYGYILTWGNSWNNNNSQNWAHMDINGDDKPDLVVTSDYQSSNGGNKQFGAGSTPYWKVYLNTGSGISTSVSNWSTPIGGDYSLGNSYGYLLTSAQGWNNDNSQCWSLVDMNGDKKPDLLITSEYQTSNGGYKQFGAGSSPYWKVYLNTGTGFSGIVTNWSTPIGGDYYQGSSYGYLLASAQGWNNDNSQCWSLTDINADNKPDLVVSSDYQTSNGGYKQWGAGSSPYWKVYLNTGSGFSSSVTNWSTPIGGDYYQGSSYGYLLTSAQGWNNDNSQCWNLMDMNGDKKADLVVSSDYQTSNGGYKQWGAGSSPYWKVYLNTGSGFSSSVTNWSTPIGGDYYQGSSYGYLLTSAQGWNNDNSQCWSLVDMTSDGKPDLVVTSDYQTSNGGYKQFGAGNSPYWKLYLNTGSAFSGAASNFTTPIGGEYSSGNSYGYLLMYGAAWSNNNSQNWTVEDMNADGKPDLVVPSDYQSANGGEKQFGAGSNPYWKVYLNNGLSGLEEAGGRQLQVYPNPFTDKIAVNGNSSPGVVEVYSAIGEKVYQSRISTQENLIDLSGIPAGMYFLKFSSKEAQSMSKIVKQ